MAWLDAIFFVVIGLFAYLGYKHGATRLLIEFAAWWLMVFLTGVTHSFAHQTLGYIIKVPSTLEAFDFFVPLVIFGSVIGWLVINLPMKIKDSVSMTVFGAIGGLGLGVGKALIICAIFSVLLLSLPIGVWKGDFEKTPFGEVVWNITTSIHPTEQPTIETAQPTEPGN